MSRHALRTMAAARCRPRRCREVARRHQSVHLRSARLALASRLHSQFCQCIRFNIAVITDKAGASPFVSGDRRLTVRWRWLGGCAGSEVRCAPADEPVFVLYAPRATHFATRIIRAVVGTHASSDPRPVVSWSARPGAGENHGSQVRPPKLRRTDSETSYPSLPVEPTLRL